jgi:predicted nucleic acid-binding Zn ribbon protein
MDKKLSKKIIIKKCEVCGASFVATKDSQRYCCEECKKIAKKKNEEKRAEEHKKKLEKKKIKPAPVITGLVCELR